MVSPERRVFNISQLFFRRALEIPSVHDTPRMRFGAHWPLAEFWEDKLKKPMSVVHDFINPIVAQAIQRKRDAEVDSKGLEKDRDDETLLENLVNSTEDPVTL